MKKKKVWITILILVILIAAMIVAVIPWQGIEEQREHIEQPAFTNDSTQHTVKFLSDDGVILKIDSVGEGGTAEPPTQTPMVYGKVFQSWDADLSHITGDTETRPLWVDVSGKANVFAVDGAYGKIGDTVSVPVRLCGEVCASAFDMTISYNEDVLELISVTEDGAVLYNHEVPGTIRLNYVSTDNTVADVDICWLTFRSKGGTGQFPVTLELHNIYACENPLESENDDLYVPEYTFVNGMVIVLPEGE